ncbi:phosphoserine phosphatase [Sorangium cellulosum]|uniref:Phosphoserine phosphatase n=1 Tax=Sorangium cellulosum TaxID=56 RepID=A0A2L0EUI8_SORCE|nr:SpoIIE family protein phosphatase [Sorangium cellulosum]AUX42942.1 phosphoserine phosphatase [Sorangium cellulosum]
MTVAIGTACCVASGEEVAGDEVVVVRQSPWVLIGLADGLGHGPHAAEAASAFCRYVEEHASMPLEELLTAAGEQLSSTRGAAAALVRIDESAGELEFSGVGNIAMKAMSRTAMPIFCSAGILGRRVRRLRSFRFPMSPGDVVVLHSDGIASGFDLTSFRDLDPQEMARRIVEAHKKSFDDATCVVALLRDRSIA